VLKVVRIAMLVFEPSAIEIMGSLCGIVEPILTPIPTIEVISVGNPFVRKEFTKVVDESLPEKTKLETLNHDIPPMAEQVMEILKVFLHLLSP
jgi:hypothetical protein